jgi:hypothetical protein
MDINNKLNIRLTYRLYLHFLLRKQFLLQVYIFLTAILCLACILKAEPFFTDVLFSFGNLYLIIIFFSDNEKSFNHFRKIFNITAFTRLIVKSSTIYLLLYAQILIIQFSASIIPAEVIAFYSFLVSSILCLFILSYDIKNMIFKILAILVSFVLLTKLYLGSPGHHTSVLMLLSLVLATVLFSVIKLKYEANNYL